MIEGDGLLGEIMGERGEGTTEMVVVLIGERLDRGDSTGFDREDGEDSTESDREEGESQKILREDG
jgi:hypothetical protein